MPSRMQSTRLARLNIAKSHALQNKKHRECMADCSRVYDNMYSDDGIFHNFFAQSAYGKGLACAFQMRTKGMFCSLCLRGEPNGVDCQVAANEAFTSTSAC